MGNNKQKTWTPTANKSYYLKESKYGWRSEYPSYRQEQEKRDYRDYNRKDYSHSSSWTSHFSYWKNDSNKTQDKLDDALKTVGKTVYVLGTKERTFKLRFREPGVNVKFLGSVIEFDQSVITGTSTELTSDQRTDVMCGEALIASSLRLTVDNVSLALTISSGYIDLEGKSVSKLYKSAEVFKAKENVLVNCPGFQPYLKSYEDYNFDSNAHNTLISKEKDFNSACYALNTALIFQEVPIDFGTYQEDIDNFIPQLATCVSTAERVKQSKEVVQELIKKYSPPKEDSKDSATGSSKIDRSLFVGVEIQLASDLKEQENDLALTKGRDSSYAIIDKFADRLKIIDGFTKTKHVIEEAHSSDPYYYGLLVKKTRTLSEGIKDSLVFSSTEAFLEERGLRSGILDEGSLEKLTYNSSLIFERKEILSKPKLSITLLIDESGSMGSRNKIEDAKLICTALYEAMKDVEGVQLGVYGHSTSYHHGERCHIYRYKTPNNGKADSFAYMKPRGNNLDSYAMRHVTNDILTWADTTNVSNILFVISDGQPAGQNYGGALAYKDMLRAVEEGETKGVKLYGIGICNAYDKSLGETMYGPERFIVLQDSLSSAKIIGSFIGRLLQKS